MQYILCEIVQAFSIMGNQCTDQTLAKVFNKNPVDPVIQNKVKSVRDRQKTVNAISTSKSHVTRSTDSIIW